MTTHRKKPPPRPEDLPAFFGLVPHIEGEETPQPAPQPPPAPPTQVEDTVDPFDLLFGLD